MANIGTAIKFNPNYSLQFVEAVNSDSSTVNISTKYIFKDISPVNITEESSKLILSSFNLSDNLMLEYSGHTEDINLHVTNSELQSNIAKPFIENIISQANISTSFDFLNNEWNNDKWQSQK